MPLPVDYGTGVVTGTFTDTNGDPVVGTVSFTPSASRLLGTGAVILGESVVVDLDAAGSLSVTLPASDDPNVNPTDFTYRVDETFVGTVGSTYFIDVLEGTTLDLSDVAVPGVVNNGTVIFTASLPTQTGHAGEYLTTDGTSASWAAVSGFLTDSTVVTEAAGEIDIAAAAAATPTATYVAVVTTAAPGTVDIVLPDPNTSPNLTVIVAGNRVDPLTDFATFTFVCPAASYVGVDAGTDLSREMAGFLFITADGSWFGAPLSTASGSGDVFGPASAVDNRLVTFDGITGKLIQDSGFSLADLAPIASPVFTGAPEAPTVKHTGNTGANTTPLLITGANATGAPASGAHVKGEVAGDDTGKLWYCTVAGTPGTWVQVGVGGWQTIARRTLGSTSASESFTVTGYKKVRITLTGRSDRAAATDSLRVRMNADTGNNYGTEAAALISYAQPCAISGSLTNTDRSGTTVIEYGYIAGHWLAGLAQSTFPASNGTTGAIGPAYGWAWTGAASAAPTSIEIYPGVGLFVAGTDFLVEGYV